MCPGILGNYHNHLWVLRLSGVFQVYQESVRPSVGNPHKSRVLKNFSAFSNLPWHIYKKQEMDMIPACLTNMRMQSRQLKHHQKALKITTDICGQPWDTGKPKS